VDWTMLSDDGRARLRSGIAAILARVDGDRLASVAAAKSIVIVKATSLSFTREKQDVIAP